MSDTIVDWVEEYLLKVANFVIRVKFNKEPPPIMCKFPYEIKFFFKNIYSAKASFLLYISGVLNLGSELQLIEFFY
jgi:hypothetical protein